MCARLVCCIACCTCVRACNLVAQEFYLSVCYPRIFQEMGVLYKNDGAMPGHALPRLTLGCRHRVHAVLPA